MPIGRIQQRIDPLLQKEAEALLITQGIKPSQAIVLFYTEIRRFGGLPFAPTPVRQAEIPNLELQKDLQEARKGKGIKTYKGKSDFFASLKKV